MYIYVFMYIYKVTFHALSRIRFSRGKMSSFSEFSAGTEKSQISEILNLQNSSHWFGPSQKIFCGVQKDPMHQVKSSVSRRPRRQPGIVPCRSYSLH